MDILPEGAEIRMTKVSNGWIADVVIETREHKVKPTVDIDGHSNWAKALFNQPYEYPVEPLRVQKVFLSLQDFANFLFALEKSYREKVK